MERMDWIGQRKREGFKLKIGMIRCFIFLHFLGMVWVSPLFAEPLPVINIVSPTQNQSFDGFVYLKVTHWASQQTLPQDFMVEFWKRDEAWVSQTVSMDPSPNKNVPFIYPHKVPGGITLPLGSFFNLTGRWRIRGQYVPMGGSHAGAWSNWVEFTISGPLKMGIPEQKIIVPSQIPMRKQDNPKRQ